MNNHKNLGTDLSIFEKRQKRNERDTERLDRN